MTVIETISTQYVMAVLVTATHVFFFVIARRQSRRSNPV